MSYVVVPIDALDSSARQVLATARSTLEGAVVAVCVATTQAEAHRVRAAWEARPPDAELVIIEAPSDAAEASRREYIDMLRASDPMRKVTVLAR